MKTLILGLALASMLFAGKSCDSENECPEDVICSMIFKSIAVAIIDKDGSNVPLTTATVTSRFFDESINALDESPVGGPYTIVNDSHMKWLSASTPQEVEFKGWIGDSLVVQQSYKIRHDCCHVVLVEGPEQIQLN